MARAISRQAFVRGALGAAAGALLGSCRPTASSAPQNSTPTSGPPPPAVSGPQDWGALDDAIDGRVILPSSAEYGAAKDVFNSRFADSTPAAVVTVKSTDDVRKAVEFAAKDNIKISARGGGH